MPIEAKNNHFNEWVQEQIDSKTQAMIKALEAVGADATTEMRLNHGYETQTGMLQSSTGACVVAGGQIVFGDGFQVAQPKPNVVAKGKEGASQGESFIKEIASGISSDEIALILVAGANYAAYVEAKGRNVMDSAIQLAKSKRKILFNGLGIK